MTPQRRLLAEMLCVVVNAHYNQFDKAGEPYFLHCFRVYEMARTTDPQDEELWCIALGHDLFEDTSVTADDLRSIGMTDRIIAGIYAMTKMPGQSYDEYRASVKANPDAVKVKMCDLKHNSDLSRLKGVTDKDKERQAKYMLFYKELHDIRQGPTPSAPVSTTIPTETAA